MASAAGINAYGVLACWVQSSTSVANLRAVWSRTGLEDDMEMLTGMIDEYSKTADINDDGQIVGSFSAWDDPKGFLWSNGSISNCLHWGDKLMHMPSSKKDTLPGEQVEKKGRNNPSHAFLWHQDIGILDPGTLKVKVYQ